MLSLIDPSNAPKSRFSKQTVECRCSCGNPNVIQVRWNIFALRIPTCGKCALYKWLLSGITEYNGITLSCHQSRVENIGRQLLPWRCKCGKEFQAPLSRVMSGNTTSCGCSRIGKAPDRQRHAERAKHEWMKEVPELVDEGLPDSWSFRSRLKPKFKCHCSKVFSMTFWAFKTGVTTCGLCNIIERGQILNGMIYDGDKPIDSRSTKKEWFLCQKCGTRDEFVVRYVSAKKKTGCRNCVYLTEDEAKIKKFGRLQIKTPKPLLRYSTDKEVWVCSCGNETLAIISNVINGTTKSCGNCRKNVSEWHRTNESTLRSLKCPVDPLDFPPGGVKPLEIILSGRKPFVAECPSCRGTFKPRLNDMKRGVSLTCGCASNRVSSGQNEIHEYILSLGLESILEFQVGGLKYDISIPSCKTLIEFQGLIWHVGDESRRRDNSKYTNALDHGWSLISIFDDEWRDKKDTFKNLIRNRLGFSSDVISLRPQKVDVREVSIYDADDFYDKNHYIGSCRPHVSIGAFYDDKLIACISFSTPTRQSKHNWELVRMASDPNFRVHGIWSKLLKQFICDQNPKSIVSFSDNRLFPGGVYSKLGFKLDGELRSDYYWVKDGKRRHKSGLRKPKGCPVTETKLRESEGYEKIWDLGKKRWVLTL